MKSGRIPLLPLAFGTFVYLVCGVAIAVLASRSLSATDYVNYVAFVSVGGIFVLGVGAAVEQETNLVYFRSRAKVAQTFSFMLPRVGLFVVALWILIFVPVGSWQIRLFGDLAREVQIAVSLGVPGLLFSSVARGITNGRSDFRRLGQSHVMIGLSTIVFPLMLASFGVSFPISLIVGQTMAWSSPLVVLVRPLIRSVDTASTKLESAAHLSGWLVLTNIALLSNMLSSQLIFRLHADTLSARVIAEAQILIMVSCFASTLTLSFMPQIIASYRRESGRENIRMKNVKRGVILVGVILPVTAATFRIFISQILLPTRSQIPFEEALLITVPAGFLVVAILLSAKLIAAEKVKQTAVGWFLGLGALWILPTIYGHSSLRALSLSLCIGAVAAPVTFMIEHLVSRKVVND